MGDYLSTEDESNNPHGRSMPKSVDNMRPKSRSKSSRVIVGAIESLQQSDDDEYEDEGVLISETSTRTVVPATSATPTSLLSRPSPRSSNIISTDRLKETHEAEIRRFRECIMEAHQILVGKSGANVKALDEFFTHGALLVESFTYKAILENVFNILLQGDWAVPRLDNRPQYEGDIPSDIYTAIRKATICEAGKIHTIRNRLLEAHNYLEIYQAYKAEIARRNPNPSLSRKKRDATVDTKFDMACVAHNRSRTELAAMQTTHKDSYTAMIGRVDRMRQYGSSVAAYTNNMGSSASLLIWPSMTIQTVTRFPLLRTNRVFLNGICIFIKGSHEFPAIQNLIDHLTTWFEGWMAGSISSETAKAQLDSFLRTCDEDGQLLEGPKNVQHSNSAPHSNEVMTELQQFIQMFTEIPRDDNVIYSTVGTAGHNMSLNITDMESLGSQRQLTERAIEAVLATTKFPAGVMFARASGYGSLYDQQKYEHGRSMSIGKDVKKIFCPIHTGTSTQHWIGVVVRLGYNKRRLRRNISMTFMDSMSTDPNSCIYDEQTIKNIVVTWLSRRLPNYTHFESDGKLHRARVELQADLNSCVVHMLLNLRAAGLDSKYISKGSNCSNKEWIDNARESFVKSILRSAGKHLGGDIKNEINERLRHLSRDN